MLKVSDEVNGLIFVELEDVVASLATVLAFSFLGIPTCEGAHMKRIELFISYVNFRMYWTSSFLEQGFKIDVRTFKVSLMMMWLFFRFEVETIFTVL